MDHLVVAKLALVKATEQSTGLDPSSSNNGDLLFLTSFSE